MGKSAFGVGAGFEEANALLRVSLAAGTLTMAPAYGAARVSEYPDFTQQVNAGAAWLDGEVPGWDELINLDNLDLDNQEQCILGQTWHHYRDAHALIGFTGHDNFTMFLINAVAATESKPMQFAAAHGFALTPEAYAWNHVESDRRVQAGEVSDSLVGMPSGIKYSTTTRNVDHELWEQLTRTWLVLIEARQTVRGTAVRSAAAR